MVRGRKPKPDAVRSRSTFARGYRSVTFPPGRREAMEEQAKAESDASVAEYIWRLHEEHIKRTQG